MQETEIKKSKECIYCKHFLLCKGSEKFPCLMFEEREKKDETKKSL